MHNLYLHKSIELKDYRKFIDGKQEGCWLKFNLYAYLFLGFYYAIHGMVLEAIIITIIHSAIILLMIIYPLTGIIYLAFFSLLVSYAFFPAYYYHSELKIHKGQRVELENNLLTKQKRIFYVAFLMIIFNVTIVNLINYVSTHNAELLNKREQDSKKKIAEFRKQELLKKKITPKANADD